MSRRGVAARYLQCGKCLSVVLTIGCLLSSSVGAGPEEGAEILGAEPNIVGAAGEAGAVAGDSGGGAGPKPIPSIESPFDDAGQLGRSLGIGTYAGGPQQGGDDSGNPGPKKPK